MQFAFRSDETQRPPHRRRACLARLLLPAPHLAPVLALLSQPARRQAARGHAAARRPWRCPRWPAHRPAASRKCELAGLWALVRCGPEWFCWRQRHARVPGALGLETSGAQEAGPRPARDGWDDQQSLVDHATRMPGCLSTPQCRRRRACHARLAVGPCDLRSVIGSGLGKSTCSITVSPCMQRTLSQLLAKNGSRC